MQITLSSEHAAVVQMAVENGIAPTPEAYIEGLLKQEGEQLHRQKEIDAMLLSGIESGFEEVGPNDLAELKDELRQSLEEDAA